MYFFSFSYPAIARPGRSHTRKGIDSTNVYALPLPQKAEILLRRRDRLVLLHQLEGRKEPSGCLGGDGSRSHSLVRGRLLVLKDALVQQVADLGVDLDRRAAREDKAMEPQLLSVVATDGAGDDGLAHPALGHVGIDHLRRREGLVGELEVVQQEVQPSEVRPRRGALGRVLERLDERVLAQRSELLGLIRALGRCSVDG